MANPKTLSSPPIPSSDNGWFRKCEVDAWLNRYLPIPTQVISNEEYVPILQTPLQRRVERTILSDAENRSKRLGMSRRQFLQTAGGTAVAFAAMNAVF